MSSPAALKSFVKLLVLDLGASSKFYEALGFQKIGADGTFVHYRWEEQGDLMLVSAPTGVRVDGKRGWGVLLCFTSSTPIDDVAKKATEFGAPVQGPEVQPWHTREVVVTDPDGYRLNFLQPA